MIVPYFHILALTFFHLVVNARAAPVDAVESPLIKPGLHASVGTDIPPSVYKYVGHSVQRRGLPVNIAQGNAQGSTPELVHLQNYQTDVVRLVNDGDGVSEPQ